ncbi:hypothetical protein [Mycoplasmopsis felis]|uniref:hypothetical protein n=2 Tax=Mycoplasmopsis felis TaxID=33923 RepID=UPI002AFE923C|nr:hypothetical protein [Mycoplasmopsis felis]WQQ03344.1 hypothetical protein RRG38_00520 [Mycoplasmopsis felis]WQQ07186.1 hypothetical protein RRG37_00975 [Mycoplasmopsis felis]
MLLIKKFKKLTFILVPVCTLLPISLVSCSKDDKKEDYLYFNSDKNVLTIEGKLFNINLESDRDVFKTSEWKFIKNQNELQDLINSFNYDINKFSESKLLKEIKSLDFSQKSILFIPNILKRHSMFAGYKKYKGWNIKSFNQTNNSIKVIFEFSEPANSNVGNDSIWEQWKHYFLVLDKINSENEISLSFENIN